MYDARTLNEAGEGSDRFIALLESLTGLQNLHLLSLLPWTSVISRQHLLKPAKAWCPVCLHQWRYSGDVVYDPLLWMIKCVTHCPVHRCRLLSSCPHCGKSLHTLSARSRPGICCWCQTWLGATGSAYADEDAGVLFAHWIAELLVATHEPGKWLAEDAFRTNLNTCIERVSDGNISRFSAVTGVSFDSVLNWEIWKRAYPSGLRSEAVYGTGIHAPVVSDQRTGAIGCRPSGGDCQSKAIACPQATEPSSGGRTSGCRTADRHAGFIA